MDGVNELLKKCDYLKNEHKYDLAVNCYMEILHGLNETGQVVEDLDVSLSIYIKLGNCYFEMNEFSSADYYFNQALFCNEGFVSAQAWLGIGKSRYQLGDQKKQRTD